MQVAHNNGIKISNGGITNPVIYSLRKWYPDRGETDSVNFVNEKFLTGGGITTQIQKKLDWYEPLLDGFAASDMDYINLHWIEYPRGPDTETTTSKLLGPLINFLQVRTGKPVITTETDTHTPGAQELLYELLDEWKVCGPRYLIYFVGDTGAGAVDLSDTYKAWLLQ